MSEQGARNAALEAMHEEEAIGKAYDSRLIARLWPYMRPHLGLVLVTVLLVFPLFLLELAPAWIIKTGIDRVIAPADAASGPADAGLLGRLLAGPEGVSKLLWLAGLYLSVMVALSALEFLRSVLMTQTGHGAMLALRKDVFAHIQRLHLGFFDRYPVGRLVTRATNDVENVAEMFSAGIVAFVTDVLKMIGFATALFLVNAKLALVTFSVVPLLAVAAVIFRLRVREAFRKIRVRIARINTYLQEAISGMKVIQLFTREARNLREFERLNAEHRDVIVRIAHGIAEFDGGVQIAGHTDDQPIRTLRFPSNWILSQRRAEAVTSLLESVLPASRLSAEGRADTEPLVDNSTPANRAQNRRVEVSLFYQAGDI